MSKQNRLLNKYSKGGFSAKEKRRLQRNLGLKSGQVRRLTNSYSRQLKISGGSKHGNRKPKDNIKSNFPGLTSTYAPGVSAPGVKKPEVTGPKNPFESIIKPTGNKNKSPRTPTKPELTVDPRVGNLKEELATANSNLNALQNLFKTSNKNYLNQVDSLRDDIGGYENQIGDYQNQVSDMSDQLLEQAQNARQFLQMDTQYLSNNTAAGIRLKRSKKFRSGGFALGTSGLNRKNRSPLKISNVNT